MVASNKFSSGVMCTHSDFGWITLISLTGFFSKFNNARKRSNLLIHREPNQNRGKKESKDQ